MSGAYLTEWMECYITQQHIDEIPNRYPDITLHLGCGMWSSSINDAVNKFLTLQSLKMLTILTHHVILREVLGHDLPLLSTKKKHQQGEYTLFIVDSNVYLSLFQHHIYATLKDVYP